MRTAVTDELHTALYRAALENFIRQYKVGGVNSTDIIQYWGPDAMLRVLSVAETFYVSPDMQRFAQMAAEDFPEDEVVLKEDLPSEAGFMVLPMRYRMLEAQGRLMIVNAVLWLNHKIWLLSDRLDLEDQVTVSLVAEAGYERYRQFTLEVGRWDVVGMLNYGFGEPMPTRARWIGGVLPVDAQVKTMSDPDSGDIVLMTDHPAVPTETEGRDVILSFMLAVWRLMQQTLSDVSLATDIDRGTRRRAIKAKVPVGVTVISLRRRTNHRGEGTGEHINYRTIVRGHWRRVWCGSRKNPQERYRRAVYIHPFFRGPEDAPLIIRDRVNALVR